MRTAFICVTVTVTSPLERIYISAGVTRRPFGFQAKGWCLSRSRNGSAHFRRYFAMGNIRGTPCMRSHICVHRATTKYFSNSFVFKTEIEKEGLPGDNYACLGRRRSRVQISAPRPLTSLFSMNCPRYCSVRNRTWVQVRASQRFQLGDVVLPVSRANKSRARSPVWSAPIVPA